MGWSETDFRHVARYTCDYAYNKSPQNSKPPSNKTHECKACEPLPTKDREEMRKSNINSPRSCDIFVPIHKAPFNSVTLNFIRKPQKEKAFCLEPQG